MFTHHRTSDSVDLHWHRPVLPDQGPTPDPIESPISRRLLRDLQLVPGDRLLALGTRDPQFLELAAAEIGDRGRLTVVEPDPGRLHRARRRTEAARHVVEVLAELPRPTRDRYDAIAVVARDGVTPDPCTLHSLVDLLRAGGKLAIVSFHAPAGQVASSGVLRPMVRPHRCCHDPRPSCAD